MIQFKSIWVDEGGFQQCALNFSFMMCQINFFSFFSLSQTAFDINRLLTSHNMNNQEFFIKYLDYQPRGIETHFIGESERRRPLSTVGDLITCYDLLCYGLRNQQAIYPFGSIEASTWSWLNEIPRLLVRMLWQYKYQTIFPTSLE